MRQRRHIVAFPEFVGWRRRARSIHRLDSSIYGSFMNEIDAATASYSPENTCARQRFARLRIPLHHVVWVVASPGIGVEPEHTDIDMSCTHV